MMAAIMEFIMRNALYRFGAPATFLILGLAFTVLAHLAP